MQRRSRLDRVSWTLTFVGLLGYTLTVVTYTVRIGEISMAVALGGMLMNPGRVRFPAFLLFFGALVLWSAAGYSLSPYPGAVRDALDQLWRIWFIAFVVVNAIRTPAHLRLYLVFFLACFALYPARGAIFNYVGGYTIWGRALWNYIYANPNDLAALTFLPLAIAGGLVATEGKGLFRWGAIASLAVLPTLILMTQSRGAFIALLIVSLFVLVSQRRKARAVVAVGGIAVVALLAVPESAWERFSGISSLRSTETIAEADPEGSAEARYNIWKVAGLIIRDYPLTGVGLGAYADAHARYAPLVTGAPRGRKDAHSTYLWVLATTGFPGFLLFAGLLATTFLKAEEARKGLSSSAPNHGLLIKYLELGLIGYLLAGVFGSYALLSFLYLHLALIWVAAEVGLREQARARRAGGAQNTRAAR